jgi:hypothetical protein
VCSSHPQFDEQSHYKPSGGFPPRQRRTIGSRPSIEASPALPDGFSSSRRACDSFGCLRTPRPLDEQAALVYKSTFSSGFVSGGVEVDLIVEHAEVWAGTIDDQPGALAGALAVLNRAGADLQCVISRRSPDQPGKGVVFVTPLLGDGETAAAAQIGFNVSQTLHSVRIIGPNQRGIVAELTEKLAEAGINLRGFSASVIGARFIAYAAVDSHADARKAIEILGWD